MTIRTSLLFLLLVMLIGVLIGVMPSKSNDFFIEAPKSRYVDIIKFKIELVDAAQLYLTNKTCSGVEKDMNKFFKENTYKPFYYTIEIDQHDEENCILYLNVYYDSYKFETFNLIHAPIKGIIGLNSSDKFRSDFAW